MNALLDSIIRHEASSEAAPSTALKALCWVGERLAHVPAELAIQRQRRSVAITPESVATFARNLQKPLCPAAARPRSACAMSQ